MNKPAEALAPVARTVADIISACGGAKSISESSDGTVTKDAVYKWPSIGIPDRHWQLIIRLSGVTPDELYQANLAARHASGAPA